MGGFSFCLGFRGETTSLASGGCDIDSLGAPEALPPVVWGCNGSARTLCTTLAPELAVGAVRPPLRPIVPLAVLLATRLGSAGRPSPRLAFELVEACKDAVGVGRKNWRVFVVPAGFVVIVLVPSGRFFTSSIADLTSPEVTSEACWPMPDPLEDATAFLGCSRCSVTLETIVLGFTAAVLLVAVPTPLDPTPIVAEFESTRPAAGRTAPCGLPSPRAVDDDPGLPSVTCVRPETILARRAGPPVVVIPLAAPRCAIVRSVDVATSGAEACVITRGRVAEVVEAVSVDPSSSSSSSRCPPSCAKTLAADADRSIPVRTPAEEGTAAEADRRRNGLIPFPATGADMPDAFSEEVVLPSPLMA